MNRIEYVDATKAIAIILMIMGHCATTITKIPVLVNFITTFHMVVFFILSGFFIKRLTLKESLVKYIRLLKYYIIGSLITIIPVLFHCIFRKGDLYTESKTLCVASLFGSVGNGPYNALFENMPTICNLWFLLALFWGSIILSCIKKKFHNNIAIIFPIAITLFLFGVISIRYIRIPLSFQAGITSVLFLYIGNVIKEKNVISLFRKGYTKTIVLSPFIIISIYTALNYGNSVALCFYPKHIFSIISGVLLSILLTVAVKISKIQGGWIGKNTIYLLLGNQVLSYYTFVYHPNFFEKLPFGIWYNFILDFIIEMTLTYILARFLCSQVFKYVKI